MCSTISLGSGDHSLLAQNYDFNLDHGLVAINLRGTVKENGRQPGEKAVRWRGALPGYASVGPPLYGRFLEDF
ncbi:MAG: hypothetical protein WA982_08735 [Rubrobacteraceae bacterium]